MTKEEILPLLAVEVGREKEMRELTEETMRGEIPFVTSFLSRIDILKNIPITKVKRIIDSVQLNECMVEFIRNNSDICYVVTGNLDVWIDELMKKIGIVVNHCFCSTTSTENGRVKSVNSVVNKELVIKQFVKPVVAVGDGSNDADMAKFAKIGIGFGGVRTIAKPLLDCATYAFHDEKKLVEFLNELKEKGVLL